MRTRSIKLSRPTIGNYTYKYVYKVFFLASLKTRSRMSKFYLFSISPLSNLKRFDQLQQEEENELLRKEAAARKTENSDPNPGMKKVNMRVIILTKVKKRTPRALMDLKPIKPSEINLTILRGGRKLVKPVKNILKN